MDNYPEDAIKSFLRIEIPKIKDKIYYEVNSEKNIISLYDPDQKKPSDKTSNFELDKIFTNENENSYIYEEICLNTIKDSLEGISFSFISYGETSSHKLDVLIGNIEDSNLNINHRGIYPRLLDNLLKVIKRKENKSKKICVLLSYFLVYDNNLIDLSNLKNMDLSKCTKNDLLSKSFIIKNETDIINKINKIKIEKTEDSLLFLNQIFTFLIQLERNTNEHIYSRSHFCISLYIVSKQNNNINNISNISFILLNGSEYLYSGKTQKLISQNQNDINMNKSLVDAAKYTLETQYTYETIYNCMKSVKCLNNNNSPSNDYGNNKKENTLFSNLTTVLYNICFSEDIPKIKYRIIGTILPNTGFYPSVKDTLLFLFDCRSIMKKKKKINYEEYIAKFENPSDLLEKKKDDYIFQLENKVKTQKRKIDELNKNIIKKDDKITFLQKTYIEQINTVKKKLNFPGDISVLIAGDENTKEAKFVKEMKEYQDCIKRNEGNMHILEKKLQLANDEIAKLKNKNTIKNIDETMINYYLSVQQAKDDRNKENNSINNLYIQIEGLKKEIDIKNKINEQLKKEIENKNNIIFNLPLSLKQSYTPNKLLSPKSVTSKSRQKETISDEKNEKSKNEETNKEITIEKDDKSESIQDSEIFYSSQMKRLKANNKKNMEVQEQKYQNLINDKNKEYDELKSYMNKINDFNKREIEMYKKELIKYNEIFMQLISNYKRIFFSKLTPQCNIITLNNKKEEFDNIILNIDKEINPINFPLLFKELECKNMLNMNITGNVSNMKKAALKVKKIKNIKNININEDKKVNNINSLLKINVPPPSIQTMKNFVKESTNEGKIIINKERLNEMSKEAIIIHCLNLNKIINEVEGYLEKYTKYKKGFSVEEFENNVNYKENTINELNNKINKLKSDLDEQIQSNYNNMTLIKSQNRLIEKLQRDLLFNDIFKNKNKNYTSTINTNMNANMLINENSTCSTLIPSINNNNCNNCILSGKKLKKSNSCLHFSNNNELKDTCKIFTKRDKNELNNAFNFIPASKYSNRHRVKRNVQNNSGIDNLNNKVITKTNTFSNNNRIVRPFSSVNKKI